MFYYGSVQLQFPFPKTGEHKLYVFLKINSTFIYQYTQTKIKN